MLLFDAAAVPAAAARKQLHHLAFDDLGRNAAQMAGLVVRSAVVDRETNAMTVTYHDEAGTAVANQSLVVAVLLSIAYDYQC
mmetsp:Transcript_7205/g.10678  ORF Transcript_7205/g.10678 Transcript_7205/m.10678 type:complete len:82 (-) Transcript_7205:1081-1326(-)